MNFIDYLEKLDTVLYLIERKATGTPKELANKLNVSEKTARRMVNCLRQQGEKIEYCKINQTYTLS